ncbi:hypothetical protein CK203_071032 [Vitis vinifera]|uniref:Uncharacterized protein n=1 Tax=Vitis vinifera TaxID=29760 RepID=A0A438E964_VITVI|nr:hypothetical protein CK203_071032 [Vitis vinifera]
MCANLFQETGWMPRHIIAKDECDNILGVVPLYLKSHSSGEFVFDYSWADAYYSYGSRYYPKLQCCVPFTPVTGQRILVRNNSYKDQVFDSLVSAMKDLTAKLCNLNWFLPPVQFFLFLLGCVWNVEMGMGIGWAL